MPSEMTRCSDCNTPFKAVPAWLATAKVKFTCTNCPKRPRSVARFEPPIESQIAPIDDVDVELKVADLVELDEEDDIVIDDLDEAKDEIE